MSQNKDITIQKAGKGNTTVVIDKDAYKNKVKDIISDSFQNLETLTFKKKSIYILFLIKKKDFGKLSNHCMEKVVN